jgi:pyruvate/2-oxoglutarate dehydrogenase complex dihydrolipoamide acyltransferase (E2) component
MSRVGSRLARLEKRSAVVRARRPERDEHTEEDEAVMAKMLETPEGRKVAENMGVMLAEAREQIIPADRHPKAEVAVIKAAQRTNPNYLDIVSRYTDYYFAAREGREPHRLWRFEQKPPKPEHLQQPEEDPEERLAAQERAKSRRR